MRLLITGADRSLGLLAARHLRQAHQTVLIGSAPGTAASGLQQPYHRLDLRRAEALEPLVRQVNAVLHLAAFDPVPAAAAELLDVAARGTYALLSAARESRIERVIVASSLALFDTYPRDYAITEVWRPEPPARAEALAPYLSELVCREFAREGFPHVVCLRFGPLGAPDGTPDAYALQAIDRALAMPFASPGYRWSLFHVAASSRFPLWAALEDLRFDEHEAANAAR